MPPEPPPADSPADLESRQRAQTERYLGLLNHVIDVCVDVVDGLQVQVRTGPATAVAIPLEHIVRTIRRTMALAQKYAEPPRPRAAERERTRQKIYRGVEDVIQRSAGTDQEARALRNELRERIDCPDMADDLDNRPIEEIITELLRDFGLAHLPGTHPWARRTPRDIADLKRRAALPPPTPARPATGPPGTQPGV